MSAGARQPHEGKIEVYDPANAYGGSAAQGRPNVAERVLLALADEHGPVFPKTLQRELDLSRSSVRRGLYALLIIGFAERGARHRSGRLWSLTDAGRRAING